VRGQIPDKRLDDGLDALPDIEGHAMLVGIQRFQRVSWDIINDDGMK
jgi:hypothetical protein